MTTATATNVCEACNGTGWDDVFQSACGMCGADLAGEGAVEAAIAEADAIKVRNEEIVTQGNELIVWARTQPEDEFLTSLATQFADKGDLSPRQWEVLGEARERATDDRFRCFKVDGEWIAYGPEGGEGETTLTTRNGERTIWLTGERDDLFRGRTSYTFSWDSPQGEDAESVESVVDGPGFYVTSDEVVVKAQESKAGRLYGKALDADTGKFEYEAGCLRRVVRKLTIEEAAAHGHRTGNCMICGRELSNEESVERGIGPICASKF